MIGRKIAQKQILKAGFSFKNTEIRWNISMVVYICLHYIFLNHYV